MKRLFVAINLPIDLKRELFEVQKTIAEQFNSEIIEAGLFKWVEMENLHLTLRFIGEVGDSQIAKITDNINKIAEQQKPFTIKTNQIRFDVKNEPRLIYLTMEANHELEKLAKMLGESKKFIGHITLARVKAWIFKRIEIEERPDISQDFAAQIPVQTIELMESVLKRTGPEYNIIKSFNLCRTEW